MPLIKRYANRKLYDTEAKRYITLDGIAELIRQQQDINASTTESPRRGQRRSPHSRRPRSRRCTSRGYQTRAL